MNFVIDLKLVELKELNVDVILATNVKSRCDNKYIITQSYSTNYIDKSTVMNIILFILTNCIIISLLFV